MKKFFVFITVAAGVMFAACNQKPAEATAEEGAAEAAPVEAQAPQTLKDVTPTRGQIVSVSYLVGIQFGSFIKGYNFGDLNMA